MRRNSYLHSLSKTENPFVSANWKKGLSRYERLKMAIMSVMVPLSKIHTPPYGFEHVNDALTYMSELIYPMHIGVPLE